MSNSTPIEIGDCYKSFIEDQIQTGKFSSATEVVLAALRLFEHQQNQKSQLIQALNKGENSGYINEFDRDDFLKSLKQKHLTE